jgi:hypothetical protein
MLVNQSVTFVTFLKKRGKSILECSIKSTGQHKSAVQSVPEHSTKSTGQHKSAGQSILECSFKSTGQLKLAVQVTFERPYFLKKRVSFLTRRSLQLIVLLLFFELSYLFGNGLTQPEEGKSKVECAKPSGWESGKYIRSLQ